MAENSAIEWTDHTFNPWIGCQKVSAGCANCYAEAFARRYGKAEWGPTAKRVRTSAANWRKPLTWNKKAADAGQRARVFCASLADVFEDNPQVDEWRRDLFDLILETPSLDWLLLTKRPENIRPALQMMRVLKRDNVFDDLWPQHFQNVWIGTSVENQEQAEKRIPELMQIPARVRFLSCEPLLGAVDLSRWLEFAGCDTDLGIANPGVDWVIAGGESGPGARPVAQEWTRSLRDQCSAADVPFLFKQWGGRNKKAAGRQLDGREWSQFPA